MWFRALTEAIFVRRSQVLSQLSTIIDVLCARVDDELHKRFVRIVVVSETMACPVKIVTVY